VTLANLALRYVRWHYLLRRLDLRVQMIASLGAYVGSFAFLPVPAYAGQFLARARLLAPDVPARDATLLFAFLWERALDAWVVALLAMPVAPWPIQAMLLASLVLAPFGEARRAACRVALAAARMLAPVLARAPAPPDESALARSASAPVFAICALVTLLAWTPTALAVVPVAWAAGLDLSPVHAAAAAALSILVGGISLVPVGAGVAGLVLFDQLRALGADPTGAARSTFVFRVATAWLSVALGGVALLALLRRRRTPRAADHFDAIDHAYDAWLPAHYRDHLVGRKTAPMRARLAALGPAPLGLDVGCGRGWYAHALEREGARVVGLDVSAHQLRAARGHLGQSALLVRGSVDALPFRPGSFDFAYAVNVLHHVPSPAHQRRALEEILHLVRPGGLVFVHEMNIVNPLFRFYLAYVFPVLKGIEEGTEHYLDPRRLPPLAGARLVATEFFTFIPDFVPARLLPLLARLEHRLERSRLARQAAHFVVVYERTAEASIPAALGAGSGRGPH
jgi:SAM-dependent methyltransferase